jgi:mono/diheme cytochrome c family protein
MRKQLFAFLLLLPAGFLFPARQPQKPPDKPAQAEYKIPPEAVKQPNPVKPSPASIAQGKKIYGYDCAMCHGVDGDGKGELAADMKLNLADLRDPASLKDRTDGELFYVIKTGKGKMAAEGDRVKTDDLWNLVNFIRSLTNKDSGAKPKTDKK